MELQMDDDTRVYFDQQFSAVKKEMSEGMADLHSRVTRLATTSENRITKLESRLNGSPPVKEELCQARRALTDQCVHEVRGHIESIHHDLRGFSAKAWAIVVLTLGAVIAGVVNLL